MPARPEPFLVVELPDGALHYARPGHVNTLCGAERYTNADVREDHPVPDCDTCLILCKPYEHPEAERAD